MSLYRGSNWNIFKTHRLIVAISVFVMLFGFVHFVNAESMVTAYDREWLDEFLNTGQEMTIASSMPILESNNGNQDEKVVLQNIQNHYDFRYPKRYKDIIVWQEMTDQGREIFIFYSNEVIRLTDNNQDDLLPVTDGDFVVWQSFTNNRWHIVAYDLTLKNLCQVSLGRENNMYPQIKDGQVMWQSWRDNNWEVFYTNLDTCFIEQTDLPGNNIVKTENIKQLTENDEDDLFPQFYGNNEFIVLQISNGQNNVLGGSLDDTKQQKKLFATSNKRIKHISVEQDEIVWVEYQNDDIVEVHFDEMTNSRTEFIYVFPKEEEEGANITNKGEQENLKNNSALNNRQDINQNQESIDEEQVVTDPNSDPPPELPEEEVIPVREDLLGVQEGDAEQELTESSLIQEDWQTNNQDNNQIEELAIGEGESSGDNSELPINSEEFSSEQLSDNMTSQNSVNDPEEFVEPELPSPEQAITDQVPNITPVSVPVLQDVGQGAVDNISDIVA